MGRLLEYYTEWLGYDGKVYVDPNIGRCKIRIVLYTAVYPCKLEMISVYGDPLDKRNEHYKAMRQQLGDDWSTDILESGPDYQAMIMRTAR